MTEPDGPIERVRAACGRLAGRLRPGEAEAIDGSVSTVMVPAWWRDGLAMSAVFGEGILSLSSPAPDQFSRPVTLFSAQDVSVSAGGQYVPFAWLDGGVNVAVVRDRAPYPVAVVPPDGSQDGEPVADSLIDFIDRLQAPTVCLLVSPAGRRRIELSGERGLLIEHHGRTHSLEFDTDEQVGAHVAAFLADAIRTGFQVVSCPVRMRPLVARFVGTVAQARTVKPEIRASLAVRYLRDQQLIELVEDADIEDLIDEVARLFERHNPSWDVTGRPPAAFARRFTDWLLERDTVEDLYIDDAQMMEAFVLDRTQLDSSAPDGPPTQTGS